MNDMASLKLPNKEITVLGLLSDAWHQVHGLKWIVFATMVILFLLAGPYIYFASLVAGVSHVFTQPQMADANVGFVFPLALLLLLIVGFFINCFLIITAVRKVLGKGVDLNQAYRDCMAVKGKLLGIFAWLAVVIATLSWIQAIIPPHFLGSLLKLALSLVIVLLTLPMTLFAVPLVVMQNMETVTAIKAAYHYMMPFWLPIIVAYFILGILIFLSAIPFLLGLIWTLPMAFTFRAVVYRDIAAHSSFGS